MFSLSGLMMLFLVSLAPPAAPSCPRSCSCMWRKGKETVICRGGSFTELPSLVNSNTQVRYCNLTPVNKISSGSRYVKQFPLSPPEGCIFFREPPPSPGHFLVTLRYSQTSQIHFPESDEPGQTQPQPQQSQLRPQPGLQHHPRVEVSESSGAVR